MKMEFSENVKKYVKLQQNDRFKRYYDDENFDLMHKYVKTLKPNNVLELGCGVGRTSVYFFKAYGWKDTNFYLLDGNSGEKQISSVNYNTSDDFYNSMSVTKEYCESNGMKKYTLINIEKDDIPNIEFDLVYSTHAIGFHWSLSLYLEKIKDNVVLGSLLMFSIRNNNNAETIKWNEFQINYVKSLSYYEVVSIESIPRGDEQILTLRRI